jgi:hypothetical protein
MGATVDENAERRQFLRDEYLMLMDQYEDYDRRALSIKGWIAGGAVAALALSFEGKSDTQQLVPTFVIVLSLTFWGLEAGWKLFQHATRDRIRILEAFFRSDPDIYDKQPVPFQAFHTWQSAYLRDKPIYPYEEHGSLKSTRPTRPRSRAERLLRIASFPNVFLPYLVIIALSALVMFVHSPAQKPAGAIVQIGAVEPTTMQR